MTNEQAKPSAEDWKDAVAECMRDFPHKQAQMALKSVLTVAVNLAASRESDVVDENVARACLESLLCICGTFESDTMPIPTVGDMQAALAAARRASEPVPAPKVFGIDYGSDSDVTAISGPCEHCGKRTTMVIPNDGEQETRVAASHCAWLRYRANDDGRTWIEVCDQDSKGAFKVYDSPQAREPSVSVAELRELVEKWRQPHVFFQECRRELKALCDRASDGRE